VTVAVGVTVEVAEGVAVAVAESVAVGVAVRDEVTVEVGVTVAEDATVIVLAAVAVDTGEAVGDGRSGESSSLPQLEIARQRHRPATLRRMDGMVRLYLSNGPACQSGPDDVWAWLRSEPDSIPPVAHQSRPG
jgi:hypothetical protein